MAHIYFPITRNCNLCCPHCYMDAGPGLEDTIISEKAIRQALQNLPNEAVVLQISGGEIFTLEDTLFDYIHIIQEQRDKRRSQKKGILSTPLQTNGFWGGQDCAKTIRRLMLSGIYCINIASDDSYHPIPKEYIRNIHFNGMVADMDICINGTHLEKNALMPLGRAKNLVDEDNIYCDFGVHCKDSLSEKRLTIREDGNVYMCCFSQFKIGNILNKPLDEIILDAQKNPIFNRLNTAGIISALEEEGFCSQDIDYMIERYGPCGACYFVFIKDDKANQILLE